MLALTKPEFWIREQNKPNPISLYFVSLTFTGTSAEYGDILVTRTADMLLNALCGILAPFAGYFGEKAVITRLAFSWKVFISANKPALTDLAAQFPELKRIFERLQHTISLQFEDVCKDAMSAPPPTTSSLSPQRNVSSGNC